MRPTDMMRAVCVVMTAAAAACGGGGVSDTGTGPGPTPPVDTTKPPTVQRASITVQVTMDPTDAALAQGGGAGARPGVGAGGRRGGVGGAQAKHGEGGAGPPAGRTRSA